MEKRENYYKLNYGIRFFLTCTGLCIVTSNFKKAMKENYEFFLTGLKLISTNFNLQKKIILYESEKLIFFINFSEVVCVEDTFFQAASEVS